MSDRDELAKLIHGHFCGCDDPKCSDFGGASYDAASDIRDLGFRRTVTPEQIYAAAVSIAQVLDEKADYRPVSLPSGDMARAAARAFGLVPEDGEQ